jgi:serine/threonine-protein kinase
MAPEQAAGKADAFCPSVDVYALGAVLYELLTGRPPFKADSPMETQRQVIMEEPAPPSRLNARVPRDLETICLKCLQKEPPRRYATAAAVAEDARRFLRGEPTAARPVSLPERCLRWARRNPAGAWLLASALLLLLLLAVMGLREWSLAQQRRADAAKWEDRLGFVHGLQREGRFDEARAILGRVAGEEPNARRTEIERARADLELVERLDAIRLGRGRFVQGGGIDYDESSRAYEAAFREAGLGEIYEEPDRVASRLVASPARSALVAALDDWAACASAEPRGWILDIARRADPDPWRDRVRDQANWANVKHLEDLAAIVDVEAQPVTTMVAMGTRWRRLGGDPTEFLRRVQLEHPDDFWVNFELAHLSSAGDALVAIAYGRAALAVRPDASVVHFNVATAFARIGQVEESIHHYRKAIASDPDHTWAHASLALRLLDVGRPAEAAEAYAEALRLDPSNARALTARRAALVCMGRGEEARAEWASTLAAGAGRHEDWDGYAELSLFLGDAEEYRRACGVLLERFAGENDPHVWERTGRACLFAAATPEQVRAGAALIDRALAADPATYEHWAHPYFLVAEALAEYREGRFDNSIAMLQGEAANVLAPAPSLITAMSLYRAGQEDEARRRLAMTMCDFDWRAESAASREMWMYHVLRREAEELMLPNLAAFRENAYRPTDNDERLAFLGMCAFEGRNATASLLLAEAFAADPRLAEDVRTARRYNAACLAASAGAGIGADAVSLPPAERARLSRQARQWLRDDLAAWASETATGDPERMALAVERVAHWRLDPDLAFFRKHAELARLDVEEQREWMALWKDVDSFISAGGRP